MSDRKTTGLDLPALMQYRHWTRRMMLDPDLHGDTLLLAFAMLEVVVRRSEPGPADETPLLERLEAMCRTHEAGRLRPAPGWWVQHVISEDVPRYEPEFVSAVKCAAPMIRRDGLCGKPSSFRFIDRDPETGDSRYVGLCSRHRSMQPTFDARRKAWLANGKPSPPANTGGVLARYFALDWPAWYQWARPRTEPLPDGKPPTPPPSQRPKLRLVKATDTELADARLHPCIPRRSGMSYDIYLTVDTGGPEPAYLGDMDWNFTSNVSPMWREAGADLAEFDGKVAGECAPTLRQAITLMEADPDRFRAMDSPNGWGTYEHLMPRLRVLAEWFERHPKATVEVSR